MSMAEFMNHCTACSGNWGAMLLTGIEQVFPEEYEEVKEHYNSMDFSHGGVQAFWYLCDWLDQHGITEDQKGNDYE